MMKPKGFFQRIKQINYKKIVAVVFLAAIFYIGSAGFPSVINNIDKLLTSEHPNIIATSKKIDTKYSKMFNFKDHNLHNKGFYINLNGLMARIMGQRYVNKRVKLDNGHLASLFKKTDITLAAEQLTKLYNKQKENDKAFLFVLAPGQLPKYEDILPAGYQDYGNQNADALLDALKENGVPFLDLREEMIYDGIDHTDAFFITDHHWKPETGFWAYSKIIDILIYNRIIDPIDPMYTDIGEYNVEVYPEFFLGAFGRRTGMYYAGVDDIAIITPKTDPDISLNDPSKDIEKQGTFSNVAFDWDMLKKDYYSINPYTAYNYGRLTGVKEYRNETAPVDLKVLAIGDSFAIVPFTFLPLVFNTCDQMDMRDYQEDFEEYYSKYEPDIVIVLINPSQVAEENTSYDFFNDLTAEQEISGEPEKYYGDLF